MTPEESSAQEQELVRDLLASAAGPEPMPDEVRARLDDVLADLVARREAGEPDEPDESEDVGDTPPISLAARRRRRWPAVLGAAAAVSVLAYGAGVVGLDMVTGSGSDSMSATDSAGGDDAGSDGAGGGLAMEREGAPKKRDRDGRSALTDGSDSGAAESAPTLTSEPKGRPQNSGEPTDDRAEDGPPAETYREPGAAPQLRVATLGADIAAVTALELRTTTKLDANGTLAGLLTMDPRCGSPREAAGDARYAVRLEGDRATLVLRKVHDGLRVAQIYSCDDEPTMLASTVVPVR